MSSSLALLTSPSSKPIAKAVKAVNHLFLNAILLLHLLPNKPPWYYVGNLGNTFKEVPVSNLHIQREFHV